MKKVLLIGPQERASTGIASWVKNVAQVAKHGDWEFVRFIDNFYTVEVAEGGYAMDETGAAEDIGKAIASFEGILAGDPSIKLVHASLMTRPAEVARAIEFAKAAKKAGRQMIVHIHCTINEFCDFDNPTEREQFEKLLVLTDLFLTPNGSSGKFLTENYPKAKWHYVPNFINALPAERTYKNEVRDVLLLGNVERKKGVLDALPLAKKYPEINFWLVGGIEPSIQTMLNQGEFPNNYRLVGRQMGADLEKYWQMADLFLFPSHYFEGFSMALLEAMAQGLPCLVANRPSNLEVLKTSEGTQSFIVADQDDLAKKFINMLNIDGKSLASLGKNNRRKVKDFYTKEKVVEQLTGIYSSLF